ncbi:MAG: MFS transporter [Candidatus Hodarchaeales archaeon]
MLKSQENSSQLSQDKIVYIGVFRLIGVSIIHLAISLGVIGVYTFIPAQLAIIGWNTTIIAFLLGVATLFEVFRLVIGYLGDNKALLGSYRRNYVIIGLIVQISSLLLISQLLGSILILFGMIFFAIGSAVVATMSDAYLIDVTNSEIRGKVAASVQFFRLLGFAVGGILGALLYDKLRFEGFFILLAVISFILGLLAITSIKETNLAVREESNTEVFDFKVRFIIDKFKDRSVLLMSIFLVLFLIGVFAQDAILEPYAVRIFFFTEKNIGRLAAVWGTTTLLFIPLAIYVEKKFGRLMTSATGIIIGALGLLTIAFLGVNPIVISNETTQFQILFLLGVAVFGAGVGLATTPSTAIMLDVCSMSGTRTLHLAYFGLISTIGRSAASFIAGIVLIISSYQLLFALELIILISSFIPLIFIQRHLYSSF